MGKIISCITGYVVAPNATETALTMYAGDSLSVQNFSRGKAYLLNQFSTVQSQVGYSAITSAFFHSGTGITIEHGLKDTKMIIPRGYPQELTTKDTLTFVATGSATGGDVDNHTLFTYYEDIDNAQANLIDNIELKSRQSGLLFPVITTHVSATPVGSGYSGSVALNSTNKNMKAGKKYAWLGSQCTEANLHGVFMKSPDTGNFNIGLPLNSYDKVNSINMFPTMSQCYGLPLIPVFDMTVAAQIYVFVATDENAGTFHVTHYFAELNY